MYRTAYPAPIAYSYNAAFHCPACTFARFGGNDFPPQDARDSEGNPIGALAPWDEWQNFEDETETLSCDSCHGIIETYTPSIL